MHLDKEIEHLNLILFKMADVVQKNIEDSFKIYKTKGEIHPINDDIVDQYERLVEEICLNIILKERIYAKDLRKVSGILKMVADLERIGDHAEDIMEYNIKLQKVEKIKIDEIDNMVSVTLSMVSDSILSFIKEDIDLASKVIVRDDIVDKMYEDLVQYLILESTEGRISPQFAILSTIVVKYIERIADHAVNIAEWAIYIVNGFHKDRRIF